jgi:putative acetyltransferase
VRHEDAEGIAELLNLPGFRFGTLRLPFHSLDEVRRWLERPRDGDVALVAILDGHVIGNGGLHRRQGRRAHAGEIRMGVHDAWTGRGIGTAILGALVGTADRWLGLRRLELTCYVDNTPALVLYRRFAPRPRKLSCPG